jgi:hypothetical protein
LEARVIAAERLHAEDTTVAGSGGGKNRHRATRSQREQILAWVASLRLSGDARLRDDGGHPPSRQSVAAKKNATPSCDHKSIDTPSLIRWSIQEVRRIAIRLARKRIKPAHIIAWSLRRRAQQAVAQRAH